MYWPNLSAPGAFAQLAAAYRAKHGVDAGDLKRAMAHVSVKSHDNGARNPKAHLRNRIEEAGLLARTRFHPVADGRRVDIGAFGCECFGDGPADSLGAARDENPGSLESQIHVRFPPW